MSHTKEFILAQSGSYPECKSEIYELELLPTIYLNGYRVGKTSKKLFLVKRDQTLEHGSYIIIDKRNYVADDFKEKLEQLLLSIHH